MDLIPAILADLLTPPEGWSLRFVLRVIFATVLLYGYVVLIARGFGSRSFASFTSYDFLTNVAAGSLVASAIMGPDIVAGSLGLAVLVILQAAVSGASARWPGFARLSDNAPVVLVAHGRMQHAAMRRARVTPANLSEHMRRAGALSLADIRYAVLESGGTISIVQGGDAGPGPGSADRLPPNLRERA